MGQDVIVSLLSHCCGDFSDSDDGMVVIEELFCCYSCWGCELNSFVFYVYSLRKCCLFGFENSYRYVSFVSIYAEGLICLHLYKRLSSGQRSTSTFQPFLLRSLGIALDAIGISTQKAYS